MRLLRRGSRDGGGTVMEAGGEGEATICRGGETDKLLLRLCIGAGISCDGGCTLGA